MKAWRKFNSSITTAVKREQFELSILDTIYNSAHPEIEAQEKKIEGLKTQKLTRKQGRTHFQSEVASVSPLFWNLMVRVGIVRAV